MPSFDDNGPFNPTGGSNNAFEGNVGQAPMDFGPIDPRLAQSLVSQITNTTATQQDLPSLNAEAGSMAQDSVEDSRRRREPVTLFRYPPVSHIPTGVGRVRTSTLLPETNVNQFTMLTTPPINGSGSNQNGNASENPGTRTQTSDSAQAVDSDGDKINWEDEDRFDLLLQIAYERRHETLSEAAWKRIANAAHGGPFGNTTWNGVRLEFARLMRERFPGYGNETVEARERRENLDRVAAAQENGAPSTVPTAAIAHHVTDADDEQRERRQARQSEGRQSRRGRARGTTTNNRANGTRARGRQQNVNGYAG